MTGILRHMWLTLLMGCFGIQVETQPEVICPAAVPAVPPSELGIDPFFTRWVDAGGVPIISSALVSDESFRVALHILENMLLERPCYREALIRTGVKVVLLAPSETTTDVPEFADLNEAWPGTDWDERARGLGANHSRPVVMAPAENLARDPGDGYVGECVLVHEFAHTMLTMSVGELQAGARFTARLQESYERAVYADLWEDTYAQSTPDEYWAEGVQSWVGHRQSSEVPDGVRGPIDTRAELWDYDPSLAGMIAEVMPTHEWYPWCDDSEPGEPVVWPALTECPWRYLPAVELSCEDSAPPVALGTEGELHVINRTAGPIQLYWVSGDLKVPYGEIPRWYSQDLPSAIGTRWRFEGADEVCLGIYEVGEEPSRAIFE